MSPNSKNSHSRLILITGGARAGKSDFALSLAKPFPVQRRYFIATAVACDSEMRQKIVQHQRTRGKGWQTLEEPKLLPERLPPSWTAPGSVLVFDCLPTFVTNLLLDHHSSAQVPARIRSLVKKLKVPGVTAIVVSNEVGLGLVPDNPLGRQFRDLMGRVNQEVARSADEVYFLVAGLPWRIK